MLKLLGHGLTYVISMSALTGVGLALRYAGSWSPTTPVDPTRQTLRLDSQAAPEFAASPAVVDSDSVQTTWEIAFVTSRYLTEFGPASVPTENLHFGMTDVVLPADRTRGTLDFKNSTAAVRRSKAQACAEEKFYQRLRAKLPEDKPADVLVFVHGYNVSFDEAVCRAAQMGQDMPFSGLIIAYDWASQAKTAGYLHDQRTVDTSFQQLAGVLARLRSELSPATRLHVLAHSMGNRLTLQALQFLEHRPTIVSSVPMRPSTSEIRLLRPPHPEWQSFGAGSLRRQPLTHLVFAAPDVAPEQFQAALESISSATQFMTLYCSDTDFALEASRIVHGHGRDSFRTGDSRSRVRSDRLQIIRLSGVSSGDPFGHSYYGSHPGLLTDLAHLLQRDLPPAERATVIADGPPGRDLWRLR